MFTKRAIPINEDTLDKIAKINDGVRPAIEKTPIFFITSDDPDYPNQILYDWEFALLYEFDENEFRIIREIP